MQLELSVDTIAITGQQQSYWIHVAGCQWGSKWSRAQCQWLTTSWRQASLVTSMQLLPQNIRTEPRRPPMVESDLQGATKWGLISPLCLKIPLSIKLENSITSYQEKFGKWEKDNSRQKLENGFWKIFPLDNFFNNWQKFKNFLFFSPPFNLLIEKIVL